MLGIGRATVLLLAKCGAIVIAVSRTQDDLDSLKEQVTQLIERMEYSNSLTFNRKNKYECYGLPGEHQNNLL